MGALLQENMGRGKRRVRAERRHIDPRSLRGTLRFHSVKCLHGRANIAPGVRCKFSRCTSQFFPGVCGVFGAAIGKKAQCKKGWQSPRIANLFCIHF